MGVVAVGERSEADQAGQRSRAQQVRHHLPLPGQAGLTEAFNDLRARERLAGELAADQRHRVGVDVGRHAEVGPPLERLPIHLRTQQVEQPTNVGRGHEMQRPAHQPGADDRARLDPLAVHVGGSEMVRARPYRQHLAHRILRLHRPNRPRQLSDAALPTRPKHLRLKPHASGLFSGQLQIGASHRSPR